MLVPRQHRAKGAEAAAFAHARQTGLICAFSDRHGPADRNALTDDKTAAAFSVRHRRSFLKNSIVVGRTVDFPTWEWYAVKDRVGDRSIHLRFGGVFVERQLKGISVILFGVLLCCAEREWKNIVFTSIDMPMSVIGVMIGVVGLIVTFTKEKRN